MELGLAERVAFVTGGSQGIGKVIARSLAQEQVKVAICARSKETLSRSAAEIKELTGVEVLDIPGDVSNSADVQRMVDTVVERFGRIDILINNAASFRSGTFFELDEGDWIEHYDVKLLGTVRMVKAVVPHMKARHWGRIVNLGGGAARTIEVDRGWGAGVVNAGVSNLSKRLANLLGPDGITVNALHPGGANTERREAANRRVMEAEGITYEELSQRIAAKIPIRRPANAQDTANFILYLVSELADAFTGQTVALDGGKIQGVYY